MSFRVFISPPNSINRFTLRMLKSPADTDFRPVAFCCVSTGIYGYDNSKAAGVALRAVRRWLDENPEDGCKSVDAFFSFAMFGCIVAGRLVQTNLHQVDVNKFTFQLDDAENINHIVVFLLGTVPFQQGYAATVHLLWPNKTWQLLGMLSNQKASAIFRLKPGKGPRTQQADMMASLGANEMAMDSNTTSPLTGNPITATLGISIESIESVLAQTSTLSSSSSTGPVPTLNNALVPLGGASQQNISPDSVVALAQKVMSHLYNHVTSFATAVLPPGSNVLVPTGGPGSAASVLQGAVAGTAGSNVGGNAEPSYLPVKAFNDWYQTLVRKAKTDPMFLSRE
ncbi:hypothetical protein BGW38_001210 [Lunasporangiospora selenospora]|uniref:Hikeshi-like N-terminal domain-containing protein n=1 Tax=Lunasporangiospora selenospora TaxID=979761 RepID=A0A9P6FU82_9FUNG|nr:hypothetical protein BGW38_001210 [Lunasporangiospora selenospora]